MKAWKFEAWVAIAALVASSLTAAAALYQSRVFSDQLQATVWPYLSFDSTSNATSFELSLENDGAGPAIITGAQLLYDGKQQPTLLALLQHVGGKSALRSAALSSLGPGQVIRPGASASILKLSGPNLSARLQPAYNQVSLRVWYCSLLNKCWMVHLHSTGRPQEINGEDYPHTSIQPQ